MPPRDARPQSGKEPMVVSKRIVFVGLCSFLVCGSVPLRAQETAEQLLQACENLERGLRFNGKTAYVPSDPDSNRCWGFFSAVQQTTAFETSPGNRLLFSCPGPTTTLTQIIRVFINFAHAHPEKLNERAAVIAYDAMQVAFPCR